MVKKSFRNMIDLQPSKGDSFFGLTRQNAKRLALVFIFSGIALADPPMGLIPLDFLNIAIAGWLAKTFTQFNMISWLIFTYTFLAWGLIFAGAYIYPHNTMRVLNGTKNRLICGMKKALKNPLIVLISLTLMAVLYKWYSKILS